MATEGNINININNIIIRKKEILSEISIFQKKIITLETELIQLEHKLASFSNNSISDNLVLNDNQREIVESKEKNILVVACPGSGKTHTLISRYIHLVTRENIDPTSIILITFTKKAGMEMTQRISNILPHKQPYYVGSLHGLGFRLLQEYNSIKGANYTVLDENDCHLILRRCAHNILESDENLEEEEVELLKKQIIYIYDKVSTNYPINLNETIKQLSISSKYKSVINNILKEYKTVKKNENLVDFNDLMISFCQLLGTKKITPFLDKIKYIFFDEYQDINPVQNYILGCFKKNPDVNLMVVGDDAQAIYAFRGSSVKYIWEFEKKFDNVKTYFLETNYRSTPAIVNFFQDIISHNTNQFKKNVKSNQEEPGMKPYIMAYNSNNEQYKLIAEDIYNKYKSGISLKEMVVLSRKNSSLESLEHELILHNIPVIKSIGVSLLNKQHIKDFIAFLTIITNSKSSIHWKRILALHKNIGVARANEIIDNNSNENNSNYLESIKNYKNIDTTNLRMFYDLMININDQRSKTIKEKVHMVQSYLIYLWELNTDGRNNMEQRKSDMISLLAFMNKQSIEEFINNIHLNLEIDNHEDSLFLSTVHSSKGLEWEYVYLLDMDCKNFPNIRQNYYKEEIDNVMEERRLFYVAASRAKKYLSINFSQDMLNNQIISPFIRELDNTNYIGSNLCKSISSHHEYSFTGNISTDVNNYLRFNGYKSLTDMVLGIPSIRENIGLKCDLPVPVTLKNRLVVGNMMDLLISKIIHNNFTDYVDNFELNKNNYNQLPEKIYHNYIDNYTDWRNILADIFYIATYKNKIDGNNIDDWREYLCKTDICKEYYNSIEKCIIKLVNKLLNNVDNKILIHTNITMSPIKGEVDFIINDTLIEMKTTPDDACTFPNVCQTLMYGYLLERKNIKINKIIILNVWDGTMDTFDINSETNFNFKKFKKTLYYKS
jgi:DNA helicase-2/ATP-dependent DNA helicase PcrA